MARLRRNIGCAISDLYVVPSDLITPYLLKPTRRLLRLLIVHDRVEIEEMQVPYMYAVGGLAWIIQSHWKGTLIISRTLRDHRIVQMTFFRND